MISGKNILGKLTHNIAIGTFLLLFVLGCVEIVLAEKGSIIISDISIDGNSTPFASSWKDSQMSVGDTPTNEATISFIRFNWKDKYKHIKAIKHNITSVKVWVYLNSTVGNPNSFSIRSNYSQNDTWGMSVFSHLVGSSNLTDYSYGLSIPTKQYYFFEVTSQFLNDSNGFSSITLETGKNSDNDSIGDQYLFNTSESGNNRPYMEIQYDTNSYIDGGFSTRYPNRSESDRYYNGSQIFQYFFLIFLTDTNEIIFFQDTIGESQQIRSSKFNPSPSKNCIDFRLATLSCFVPRIIETQGNVSMDNITYTDSIPVYESSGMIMRNNLQKAGKKYYVSSPNRTLNFWGDTVGPVAFYMGGKYFDQGDNKPAEMAREIFYTPIRTDIVYQGISYNVKKSYTIDFEHAYFPDRQYTYPSFWQREIWISWNTNESSGAIWAWQVNDYWLAMGSMIDKYSHEYISFDNQDIGESYTLSNKTAFSLDDDNKILMFNSTVYANSSKGYLILNLSQVAIFTHRHSIVNITGGFFKYNDGSILKINSTLTYYEDKIFRNWDYIDAIENAYLARDIIEGGWSQRNNHNFTVRGNNNNNITVGIYNTTKLYNSTTVKLKNCLDGIYNNLTLEGNGTYVIKSLNVSVKSSKMINITVTKYNLTTFNFIVTNIPSEQKMDINIYDDTFNIIDGVNYSIKKDGIVQQSKVASNNTVSFTNISVGGDYNIEEDTIPPGTDTIGIYRNGSFYLRNSNSAGNADLSFIFGIDGDTPLVGDWNGDGIDTVGIYRNGSFYLHNSNSAGNADLSFIFGIDGDTPLVGDWNGDGIDTVGIYRNGSFYLRNSNSAGNAELSFIYGIDGDTPLVGDWNRDGNDTVGLYRSGAFYLRNSNDAGNADLSFIYGIGSDKPLVGDWDRS